MRICKAVILLTLFITNSMAGEMPWHMDGSGTTSGAYNGFFVEGWSYFDSKGAMRSDNSIELKFTILHETSKPDQYRGIIKLKGNLIRKGNEEKAIFDIKSCDVTSGYDMCPLFGKGVREIETYGETAMFFNLENAKPRSTTQFKLFHMCGSCPPYPIPTPPGEEKQFTKKKCYKFNPKKCPEDTDAYYGK